MGQAQTSRRCPSCSSEACPHLTEASRLSLRDVSKAFALAGYVASSGKPLSSGNRSKWSTAKALCGVTRSQLRGWWRASSPERR
jgi:hypothetical protein